MAPFIRIVLRYIVGALMVHGYLSDSNANFILHDPDVVISLEIILGMVIGTLTELGYVFAKKRGWRT